MTNEQIIAEIATTIYGKDAVLSMLENGQDIPLHTAKGWVNARGGPYSINKGEHGLETRLWRKRKPKENKSNDGLNTSAEEISNDSFYMAKAYLFRADQVHKIEVD